MPFVEIKTPCFPDGTIGVSGLVLYKNSQLFEPRSFFYTSLLMLFFMPRFSQPEKQQVDLQADKKALRSYYSGVRNALGPEECSRASSLICDVIRSLDEYKNAEYVAAFSALGAEPDLSPLFSEKRLFLPRYVADKGVYEMVYVSDVKNDLVIGKYGIAEPRRELEAAGEEWCRKNLLYLVPAVACDQQGVRLGRGGGFYDRLLDRCRMPAIGVIFGCQLAECLPHEEHDIKLAMAVTENGCVRF